MKHNQTHQPPSILSPIARLAVIRQSQQLNTERWGTVCDVTLTLRQAQKSKGIWVRLDEYACRAAFRHFMNFLNRAAHGYAFQRFGKRIRVIPVLEKELQGRWHYHAAMELPSHLDAVEFEQLIQGCWEKVHWGYPRTLVRDNANQRWVKYMLKPSQKTVFDDCADCIDWENLHNPIADASRPVVVNVAA